MVSLGKVVLGRGPVMVVTIEGRESLALLRKAKQAGAKILELRIDRFPRLDEEAIFQKIHSYRTLEMPLIATLRSAKEGGARKLSDTRRLELFRKILHRVEAIDLELASKRLTKILIPLAHRKRKHVILSYHNFHATPSDRALMKLIQKGKRAGADVMKIAVTPKTGADVGRLLLFTQRNREKHLVCIAMGSRGRASRVLGPLFGSLLTYSFIGRSQAPGQIPLFRLAKALKP